MAKHKHEERQQRGRFSPEHRATRGKRHTHPGKQICKRNAAVFGFKVNWVMHLTQTGQTITKACGSVSSCVQSRSWCFQLWWFRDCPVRYPKHFFFFMRRRCQLLLMTFDQTDFRALVFPLVLAVDSIGEGALRRSIIPSYSHKSNWLSSCPTKTSSKQPSRGRVQNQNLIPNYLTLPSVLCLELEQSKGVIWPLLQLGAVYQGWA